jgi:probable phosphoglycerate mutase
MTRILLVRHGETPWTREGRVQGWAAVPLTERGVEQARAAGAYIGREYDRVDRIVASDVQRASESAECVHAALSDPPEIEHDEAWRERDFGVYQGFTDEAFAEAYLEREYWGRVSAEVHAPQGGESWRDVETRVLDRWAVLEREVPDETVVFVTHTGPIWCVLTAIQGGTLLGKHDRYDLNEGGVTEIKLTDEAAEVVRLNVDPGAE